VKAKLSYETYIPFLVNRAATAMLAVAASEIAPYGLTVQKWRVLFLLWEQERCLFGTCSDLTSIGHPTLSRLTAAMERERLIVRTRVPADTRSVELRITKTGRQLAKDAMISAIGTEKKFLAGVTAAERAALQTALEKIYRNASRELAIAPDNL
jgi:MarR family transcriptional regulator, organic hydroperoxide resistance regulator